MHEPVIARSDERKTFKQRLAKADQSREDGNANDGSDEELPAEGFVRNKKQCTVQHPDHDGRIPREGIVQQRSYTCYTSHDDGFRNDKARVANGVKTDTDEDEEIIFQVGGEHSLVNNTKYPMHDLL